MQVYVWKQSTVALIYGEAFMCKKKKREKACQFVDGGLCHNLKLFLDMSLQRQCIFDRGDRIISNSVIQ